MAAYTVYTSAVTGTAITPVTPANGDTMANDEKTVLIVENNSGGTVTFKAVTTITVETTLNVDDRTESIDNGQIKSFGPFKTAFYSSTVTFNTWSDTTSVTVYALKVS